jgi:hypothetical protein
MFLGTVLRKDEENLIITPNDNINASFPTKDRNNSFTIDAYNTLAGVASFARDGEDKEKLRHKGFLSTRYVSKEFRGMELQNN